MRSSQSPLAAVGLRKSIPLKEVPELLRSVSFLLRRQAKVGAPVAHLSWLHRRAWVLIGLIKGTESASVTGLGHASHMGTLGHRLASFRQLLENALTKPQPGADLRQLAEESRRLASEVEGVGKLG